MTDEHDKEALAPDAAGSPGAKPTPPPVEDWASAFEALEAEAPAPAAAAPDDAAPRPSQPAGEPGADEAGQTPPEPGAAGDDALVDAGDAGGPGSDSAGAGEDDGDGTPEARIEAITKQLDEIATNDTLELFTNKTDDKGNKVIRQSNGQLGASINDPDIYRIGENGVPVFTNPDTGKPFTGDDPRAQAMAWVDRYNGELRESFNSLAETRYNQLQETARPAIELIKFESTYDKLDPVRQKMFEALLDGHEVYDNDEEIVGYKVDLNATLDMVNRQVTAIQASRTEPPAEPTSPALDMPNSGKGVRDESAPKSIEEAMERAEQAKLDKLKG